jgi:aspartyl-tRNA(Asn)/glutamyl-tRNA(Gln) amidotransferase subunit B
MVAKNILKEMFETGRDPSSIIKEKGLLQGYEKEQIEKEIKEIIKENKQAVEDYQRGKKSVIQFLLGQLMQRTRGGIDPKAGEKIIEQFLKK